MLHGSGRRYPVLAVLALIAACSNPQPTEENKAAEAGPAVPPGFEPKAAPTAAAFKQEEKTDLLQFAYSYPEQAATVPQIVAKLQGEMKQDKADALKMAREDRKARADMNAPPLPHALQTAWSVHADTPALLALEGETYAFTGGAHGMTGYTTLLWDKVRRQETSLDVIVASPPTFAASFRDRFCDLLDAERAKKRGATVKRDSGGFTDCVDPAKQVIVPESSNGKTIDRLNIVIGPYEAGPYAEGTYEVAVPVDAAMLKAVRPAYRAWFAGGAQSASAGTP